MTTHVLVFALVALAGVPLLMMSLPEWWVRPRLAAWRLYRMARRCSRPWFAGPVAATIVVESHLPTTVDRLPQGTSGSFVLVMAWLAAGTLLWLPLLSPVPEHRLRSRWAPCVHLGLAAGLAALVSGELLRTGVVPFTGIDTTGAAETAAALSDQHLAGGLLHLVVAPIVVAIVTLVWLGGSPSAARRATHPSSSATFRTSREPDAHF